MRSIHVESWTRAPRTSIDALRPCVIGMKPSGVLVGGAYGTGRSTVAEEIATRLEAGGVPFAAIDLDWLM